MREGKKVELRLILGPQLRAYGTSRQFSGFPAAFSVAVDMDPASTPLCGGPVVGRDGPVVGVALFRLAENRVVEGWVLGDVPGLLGQLSGERV